MIGTGCRGLTGWVFLGMLCRLLWGLLWRRVGTTLRLCVLCVRVSISLLSTVLEAAGRGEDLDESDLYRDVRPALATLQGLGVRVIVAGN